MTKLLHFNKWYLPLLIVLFGGFVKPTNLHAQSTVPEGALNDFFSVSENTRVHFSQGNLQYKASTNTWRFAGNQYDYIGSANSNISSTYSNYIDLFGWSTSGYNHGAVCYQPWSTSKSNSDYWAYGSYTYNLYDQTGKADWGYNAISNGGNQENMGWRTLTKTEWLYVFDTRSTSSGISYAKAMVNNVNGVILLPDHWQRSYYSLSNTNSSSASFSSNIITASQWATLEQHGAVFLPAAGFREGTSVDDAGSGGYYWSATYCGNGSNYAWDVSFKDSYLSSNSPSVSRCYAQSVRLVFPSQSYFIDVIPSPEEGGAVNGAGAYPVGAECTLTATASECYHFVNWREDGTQVSTSSTYTFTVTGDRTLVAKFAPNTYTVTLNTNNGTINSGNVTSYTYGVGATLPTNVTRTGYTFGGWYDNSSLTGSPVTNISTTATGDKTFWAKWTINSYAIGASANPTSGGTVTGAGNYNYGASCTLTATPATGYKFTKWTKNGTQVSTSASYTFTVNGAATYVAQFTKKTYTIVASANPTAGGSITGAGTYEHGANCTLTTTPFTGYHFVSWTVNGTEVSTSATYTFTVTGNRTLVANFSSSSSTSQEGALNGVFSVRDGYQVYFSQGNLQYKASTNTWRFAANQYDYIGDANSNISSTYSNYIDLFGWGTSGYNHGAVCYQPWSTSETNNDYYAYGSLTYNLFDQTGKADWGYNAISNGGNQANRGWRTLTKEEWDYVFNTRITPSGIRYAKAKVNNVNGVILLPDNWQSSYYSLSSTNSSSASFSSNTITATQWTTLELHGAVFLPAAGSRSGTSVNSNVGSDGFYWSSYSDSNGVWGVDFGNWYLDPCDYGVIYSRYPGLSVRLVFPSQSYSFVIDATSSPAEGGAVSGAGTYLEGAECTLVATASAGYNFVNWTENGMEASTNSTYTFRVTGDRTLVANFSPTYTVTLHTNNGTINSGNVTSYTYGVGATLPTDVTRTGYTFGGWYDNANLTGTAVTSISTTATGDKTFWAKWTINSYTIGASANPTAGGTVSGAGTYQEGSECTLTATASAGYTFVNWTENGRVVSTNSNYSFRVISDKTVVAHFVRPITSDDGALNGSFSVSSNTQIHFSQGNLQYKASTNTWRFAENQYDYIGDANSNISSSYSNYIDLFGWGTSGYNHGATCYQPWSTSTSSSDYYAYGSATYNLFDQTGKADWGYNAISNGGNQENSGWRTLTLEEWKYLLWNRTTSSGIRYAKAKVNNVNGMILLPDDWQSSYYSLSSTNSSSASFTSNTITASQWATLEQHGAVFLPAAGYRYYSVVSQAGSYGGYWSSSYRNGDGAWEVFFDDSHHGAGLNYDRMRGYSVRLVFPSQGCFFGINASPSPAEGGAVSGAGAYPEGAECTLTVTASAGYHFVNWTENGTQVSTNTTYTFTVTCDRTLVANFAPNTYTVTLNTNDGTINSGNVTSYTYGVGATLPTDVTRTGYTFGGWYDNSNLSGTAVTSISTNATGNKTFWAKWTINSYTISASANPTAGGTVSGAGTYNYGANCTLTATPATGYNFTKWTKNNTQVSTSASYTFTVSGAATYVAQFTKKTYTIAATANPTAGGTITGAGTYEHGSSCALVATPATGYSFVNWTSGSSQVSTNASYQFTVTGAKTLVANFAPNTYTVTLNTNDGTINSGNVTSYTYGEGATLPTNVTRTGYTFGGWYDNANLSGTAVTSISTTATGNKTFWAKWTINSYAIGASANPAAGGTVNGAGTYNYGASCTLTATPATGYNFTKWTKNNAQVSTSANYTFTVTEAADYVAVFTKKTYTIAATANPTAGGTITGAGTYEHGASCTLVATPATGYSFVNWTSGNSQVSTNASYQFTVTSGKTLVANFAPNTYTVTLNTNDGTINSGNVTSYTYGEGATLPTDVTRTGYTFGGWYDNANLSGTTVTSISTTATGDKTFWAKWTINSYAIGASANPAAGGTVNGAGTYNYGASCTLTATPATGYNFTKWTKNNAQVSTSANYTFTVTEAADYVAVFTKKTYTIAATANPTAGGTITGAGTYEHGSSCTLLATPATGYSFVNWTSGNSEVSTNASYQFTVTGARTLVANFVPNTYTVTLNTNDGTINSGNVTSYTYGEGATLPTDVTRTGYTFGGWYDNANLSGTAVTSISTTATGNKTFWAKWTINSYAIGASSNPTAGGTVSGAGSYNYGASCTLTATLATGYTFVNWTENGTEVSIDAAFQFTVTGERSLVANFSLNSYDITASANPAVGGTVNGAGTFNHGESCTLTANAAEGYTFVNWTENGTEVSTDATFQFTVTGARSLVANFNLNSYDITASANPTAGGTVTGAGTFNHGESCALTSNASEGYTFVNWTENGTEVSTDATFQFTVTGERSLVANFSLNSYDIIASANPTAGGTVAGEGFVDGEGDFAYGSTCSVTATANEGYTFVNWTKFGVEVATTATYTFTVEAPTALVANFSLNSYDITATANPAVGGTVNGAGTFNHGETCTLTATASDGYTFVNWTENGNEVSTDATFQFTVTGARSLVANFSLNSYDITASANPAMGGTVTGAGTFNHGETCSLTASAADGYTFENWTENGVEVTREMAYTFTVTGARTLVANFSLDIYAVTAEANPTEGGTVAGEGFVDGEGDFAYGSTCSVTATANEGYTFVNWTKFGVEVATTATYTFTVEAPTALVAHFSLNSYDITATANPTAGGTVTGAGAYNHFESCTLTATASDGYTFENWTENGVEVTREMAYTFTVEGARTLVANFTLDIYAITAEASPAEGGTVAGEGFVDGEGDFAYGSTCTVTATANEGYTFVNWTKFGVEVATTATYTFTVEAPTVLVAHFSLNSYDIAASANPTEGGTITGAGTYTHGETVTLTATANEGYLFDGWVKDEETVSTEPSLSFTAIEDGEYVAHFTLQSYPIEITAFPTEGGMVTGAGTYYHGDICTLTATPNTGYVFLYWIKDGVQVSTEASYTFTVTGPATYVANFVNFNYEVSVVVNPAEAGTVQGAGNYDLGLTCTLTATPNEGYQFVNWTVNGEEVSSDLEYSFTVTEPVAVEANFRVDAEYHEFSLTPGWNWWSTYIEMNGVNGLALLEDALGTSGIQIKSQSSFVTYDEGWFGTLNGIVNEQSYRINMGEGGNYSLAGTIADPTAHPIAIGSGWNWIGYVENVEMDLNTAMANLDKSGDDIVKSRDCFSTYYAGYGWWGTLESLQPGGGYMYKASASGTLVYPEASKVEAFIHSPEAATWWNPDGGSYADNMSVMAVVEVNGEEVRSEEVEIGAFSQGECRGAVRLLYVAPLDRYVAFLTVHGEDGDGLSFRLKNDEGVLFARDRAVFAKDAVLGSTAEPYVLRFGNTGVTDAAEPVVTAYPNPSTGVFQLEGEGMERVEVYTMLGELVRVEEVHADTHTLNLSGCAEGVYHLRVHTQNGMRHLSVVVAE